MADTQSFNGATATYSTSRTTGNYADGSPWALTGGTITDLAPAFTTTGTGTLSQAPSKPGSSTNYVISGTAVTNRKMNGAQKNPGNRSHVSPSTTTNNASGPTSQGYDGLGDKQGALYDAAMNVDPLASGPIDISAEYTIVKAVDDGHTIETDNDGDIKSVIGCFAPFTFVTSEPAADAYRPGLARSSKVSLFKRSDVDLSVLPNLALPVGVTAPDIAALTAIFADPFYLQYTQSSGQGRVCTSVGTLQNKPNYGRDISHLVGKALLALCLDNSTYSNVQKMALIDQLIPFALDLCARIEEGGIFTGIGGSESWRKAAVVFCARLLRNSPNYSYIAGFAGNPNVFAEDLQIQLVNDALLAMTPALTVVSSGGLKTVKFGDTFALSSATGTGYSTGQTLTLATIDQNAPTTFTVAGVSSGAITSLTVASIGSAWRSYPPGTVSLTGGTGSGASLSVRTRDKYAPFMRTIFDWGEGAISTGKPGANDDAVYRSIVSGPMVGCVLACFLINGGQTLWNRNGTFDYFLDRWARRHAAESRGDGDQISVFAGALYDAYRGLRYGGAAPVIGARKADGAFVWLECDQLLDESFTPATSDFAVTVNGVSATISRVQVFGSRIAVRLANPLTSSSTAVTITYTPGMTKARSIDSRTAVPQYVPSTSAAVNVTGQLAAPVAIAMVDNNAVAYSQLNGFGDDTTVDRLVLGLRFKLYAPATGQNILYRDNNNRLYMASASILRLTLGGSTVFQHSISGMTAGTHTVLFGIDRTAALKSDRSYGVLNNGTPSGPGEATQSTWNFGIILNGLVGVLSNLAATPQITDGGFEWLWADWGSSANGYTNVDVRTTAIQDRFTTANLTNTNGQIVTGTPPKLFIPFNLAEVNDFDNGGIQNRGQNTGKSVTPVIGGWS